MVIEEQPSVEFLRRIAAESFPVHCLEFSLQQLLHLRLRTPSISTTFIRLDVPVTIRTATPYAGQFREKTHALFVRLAVHRRRRQVELLRIAKTSRKAGLLARGCTFTVRRAIPLRPANWRLPRPPASTTSNAIASSSQS